MKTDKEMAEEILKKRRLAAKGLKERGDGKPIDPLEAWGTLDIDADVANPEPPEERQKGLAARSIPAGLGPNRSG